MRAKVKYLLSLFMVSYGFVGLGQDLQASFTFRYIQQELKEMETSPELVDDHELGFDIAKKLQLLRETYTYEEPPTATNPTPRTVVEKPAIYYSVKKIDKHFKKAIKKGEITEDEARKQLDNILNIALNIRYQETAKFEEVLWDLKREEEEIVKLYANRVTLEM